MAWALIVKIVTAKNFTTKNTQKIGCLPLAKKNKKKRLIRKKNSFQDFTFTGFRDAGSTFCEKTVNNRWHNFPFFKSNRCRFWNREMKNLTFLLCLRLGPYSLGEWCEVWPVGSASRRTWSARRTRDPLMGRKSPPVAAYPLPPIKFVSTKSTTVTKF